MADVIENTELEGENGLGGEDEGSTIVEITTNGGTGNDSGLSGAGEENDGDDGNGNESEKETGGETNKVTNHISATIKINANYDYEITEAKIKVGYGNSQSLTNILNEEDGDYCCTYDSTHGSYNKKTGIMTLVGTFNYDLEIDDSTYYYVFFYFKTNSSFKMNNKCFKMTGDQLKGTSVTALTIDNNVKNSAGYSFGSWSQHETEEQNNV